MFKKLAFLLIAIGLLSACGSVTTPQSVEGVWRGADMTAFIANNSIEIIFDGAGTDGHDLYWVGSFSNEAVDGMTITSQGDTAQMDVSLLGSGANAKPFTYENDTISYELTMLGVTRTIVLERA